VGMMNGSPQRLSRSPIEGPRPLVQRGPNAFLGKDLWMSSGKKWRLACSTLEAALTAPEARYSGARMRRLRAGQRLLRCRGAEAVEGMTKAPGQRGQPPTPECTTVGARILRTGEAEEHAGRSSVARAGGNPWAEG